MNGEILPVIGGIVGITCGAVVEHFAINKANKELAGQRANPFWELDATDHKQEIKTSNLKKFISGIALASCTAGFSAGAFWNSHLSQTVNLPKSIGLVLDKSGASDFSSITNQNQTPNQTEVKVLQDLQGHQQNLNLAITYQGFAQVVDYSTALNALPLGQANMFQALNDVLKPNRPIYVISDGNSFNNTTELNSIVKTAKKNHESISFLNLSNTNQASMEDVAKSTKGQYFSSSAVVNFEKSIKKNSSYPSGEKSKGNNKQSLDWLAVIGLSTLIAFKAFKDRSKIIIGAKQ